MIFDAAIVGGGISGLTCGLRLLRSGLKPVVLEAQSRPGGNVWTERANDYSYERGPHTFMASAQSVFDLAREAGMTSQIVPTAPVASRRFIVRQGKLHAAPTSVSSFVFTRLLSLQSKLRLMTEPLRTTRGKPTDTAQQFFERRFGVEAATILAGAFIGGVYAGDPASLSAPAAFPLFWRFEQESGGMIRGAFGHQRQRRAERKARGEKPSAPKGLFSFRQGLGQLSMTVADQLNGCLRLQAPVCVVERSPDGYRLRTADGMMVESRQLVVAAPPGKAGPLLTPFDQRLGELIGQTVLAPIAAVHLGFNERLAQVPNGFGFLASRNQGVRTLGVLFPSRLFAERAPENGDLLSAFVGGMLDKEALALDDQAIVDFVMNDLRQLLGIEKEPSMMRIERTDGAIPQMMLGHLERMQEIRARVDRLGGLHLAGNYLKGIGLKDAIASGFEAADRVMANNRTGRAS